MAGSTLRHTLAQALEDLETPAGLAVNLTITGLVLLSAAIFVAQTYTLPEEIRAALDTLNTGILLLFALEYLLRLWCAEDKTRHILSLYSLIDLAVILPFFLGATDLSFVRIFRWFRILRLVRFVGQSSLLGRISSEDRVILTRILFTLFAIIFVYSGLIYQVEHSVNAQVFGTFLDALYFSVVTMTTVGFGDVTPISEGGRLLTVLMILTGIALIPWQLGDLIKRLVKTANQRELPCPHCGLALHEADAQFCRRCGTALPADVH